MNQSYRLLLLMGFLTLFLLPMGNPSPTTMTTDTLLTFNDGAITSGYQDEASWWNSTFIYRRYFNFTEPNVSDRNNVPIHVYLTFDNQHCYRDSIRVMEFEDPGWSAKEFQVWNITYYPGDEFVKAARVSFMIDVDQDTTEDRVYLYYAKQDVGSVSYPSFYPFIYKSYTFSLINLVSYYDNNNYYLEMFDDPLYGGDGTWKDPNLVDNGVDTRWKNLQVTPDSSPSGVLDRFDNVRYEPTSSSYSDFFGYYTIYANYPLAVTMGLGDKGSNTALNDWYPGVDEFGNGLGTKFILGGVEGFESRNEGKYWVQAHEDNTEVYVWTAGDTLDSGWSFYNGTSVSAWPAVLKAGEYIAKRDVVYTTYVMVNSTNPVSVRAGDSDASYARDIGGFFPSVTGDLVGEEFYTIDMGNSNDRTRITNIGVTPVTVEWWRNTGSGWVKGANLTNIPVNSSATISVGTASASNPEDILRIRAPAGSRIYVEGIYNPPSIVDQGDWNPTMTGNRFGLDYRIWGGRGQKIFVFAWENAKVDISSYSGTYSLELAAGDAGFYMPVSASQSLHDLHSNATISVVVCGSFSTSTPYYPSGDQGYGWMVPSYTPEGDEAGVIIFASDEIKLFEFDVTVVDRDGLEVEGAFVELLNTDNSTWLDDNGLRRSGLTDVNGLIIFEGLSNQTYRISTSIDAAGWLSTSYSNVWVNDTRDNDVTDSVTYIEITLDMASVDLYFEDLMGNPMADNDNEDTTVRLVELTGDPSDYVAQAQTNGTGTAHFYRVPQNNYDVYARYAGSLGWSYGYDDISNFARWYIGISEFNTGSFSHNWDFPLITLDIHVVSWDVLDVAGASIKINNSVDENAYQITKTSDASGDYTFYRIVNGTWNLDVWKADDYANTPLARNYTVSLANLQIHTSETIQLPLSRLVLRVQTLGFANVEGAQVNVTLRGVGLVAQGTTNSTGHVTFLNIHANLSYPYSVSYNVTVVKGTEQNGTFIELLVKCDSDWTYINRIIITEPLYSAAYSELNSTKYFMNAKWGQNATFSVGWFDRTGTTTSVISFDSTSWLNFTIYLDGTPIGWGSWNQSASTWIGDPSGIYFLVTIDTDFWNLGISSTAYVIVIDADTSLKDAPASIIVYLTVQAASTSQGIGTANIIEYYGTQEEHLYWLYDMTNGLNVTDLDVYTYTVKYGTQVLHSGLLSINGNGTYSLPRAALSGINVGNYLVYITLQKVNYINQSFVIDATLNNLPTVVVITPNLGYEWSLTADGIVFQYQIARNSTPTDLTSVSVKIEWLTYPGSVSYLNITRTLSASGGDLTYAFTRNVVPVGNWTVRITCSHSNYGVGLGTFSFLDVSEATTTMTVKPPSALTVDWTEPAIFFVTYFRGGTGLVGAQVTTDYPGTVVVNYKGNGNYSITFDTAIPADVYIISVSFSLANHESQADTVTVTIRVPISIETNFGSEETPLIAYWTRTFDIVVRLLDSSRINTNITGATIDYDWDLPVFIASGSLTELPGTPGLYGITLLGSQASPLINEYQITLTATFGPSSATATIFLVIQDVPNEIILSHKLFRTYFGDIATVWFYWNNTLDNAPIILPSSVIFQIIPLGTGISGVTNYGNGSYSFVVDTLYLGMNVDDFDGFYPVSITMLADGFATGIEEVYFLMSESPADMELVGPVEAQWSDLMTIKVNLRDTLHDVLVWSGATVELVYGTYIIPMISYGNGTFWRTFDSSVYFTASENPYDVTVRYSLPNYVDGDIEIQVVVSPILCEIHIITGHLQDGAYNGTWTDSVEVQFWIFFAGEASHPSEGIGTYYWVGYTSVGGTFSYASYIYTLSIDTTEVPAGKRTLRLFMTLQNHTVTPFDITFVLDPLTADLDTQTVSLEVVYDSTDSISLTFDLTYGGSPLTGATVSFQLGGITFQHSSTPAPGQYNFAITPTLVSGLIAPETYMLNFTVSRQNYTTAITQIPLTLLAPTTLTFDEQITIEYGNVITVYFAYWDTLNNRAAPGGVVTAQLPDGSNLLVEAYNSTHFVVVIAAADVGEIRTERYEIAFTATAFGYESHIGTTVYRLTVYISEPTYNFGLLGRYSKTMVNTVMLMTLLFAVMIGGVVAVRRMRIPYQIKQIDRALKQIEKGKTAKVEKIKTMGMVVSELLAPGLAELDIAAPVIETGPEDVGEVTFGEETDELLGELDALDDLGFEEGVGTDDADFEAELEAELESIEVHEVEEETPETEDVVEESLEEVPEETVEVSDEVKEDEQVTDDESEGELSESELEDVDAEVEPEDTLESDSDDVEAVEEPSEDESEADTSTKRMSKKEMIDLLPQEIKDRYPDEKLRKLSKAELQELLDYIDSVDEV